MSSATTAAEPGTASSRTRTTGGEGQLGPVLRRLLRQPGVVVGAVILLLLIIGSVFAPLLTPYEPAKISPREALQPPSLAHPLGTDHFGRDQLARLLYGGSLSLQVGLVAVAIGASIGVTLGAVAGYRGGWIDEIIGRLIDIKLAFPGILLALAVVAVLGPDLMNLMIAVGVGTIPGFCRLVRGQVLAAREFDYVLAARTLGCRHARIVIRHILPNVIAPVVVYGTLAVAGAILAGASLNYLGMGAKPPTPEWGLMLAESRDQIRRAWWLATFPGAAIMLTVISINLLGDGLRDAFDPWLKGR
ncbi:MAG TPA: ABC transporter permease [Chloroflexota bacterium]|nr:ABC transporter permease [Chloroflexota bacterium]